MELASAGTTTTAATASTASSESNTLLLAQKRSLRHSLAAEDFGRRDSTIGERKRTWENDSFTHKRAFSKLCITQTNTLKRLTCAVWRKNSGQEKIASNLCGKFFLRRGKTAKRDFQWGWKSRGNRDGAKFLKGPLSLHQNVLKDQLQNRAGLLLSGPPPCVRILIILSFLCCECGLGKKLSHAASLGGPGCAYEGGILPRFSS